MAQPVTPAPVDWSQRKSVPADAPVSPAPEPPIDPSEHAAALVHEAVRKPTVLPVSYMILENIGDRISRLTTPKPVESIVIQPKIPQPISKSTSAPESPASGSPIDPERAAALVHEAVRKSTVLPETYTIQENIGDRISRLTATKPVDSDIISPKIPQPDSQGTSADTIEPQPSEAETKKSVDDAHLEAAAPATVEQRHGDSEVVVVEPVAVEETTDDKVVAQPIEVEQTPSDESVAVALEPTEIEETIDTNTPVAEAEEGQAATFLERVSSAIEAVSTVFKSPDAEHKDSETVVEEPLPSDPAASEAPIADTVESLTNDPPASEAQEAQTPTLLERVSSAIEAVSTAFKNPDAEHKDSETVVEEPSPSDPAASEAPIADTVEPLTNDLPASETQEAQTPTLLERVSSVIEAVSTAFKNPDAEYKDSETVEEPSLSDPPPTDAAVENITESVTTDAPVSETEKAQTLTLLEQVSSPVEAVATPFKDSDADKKNSEAVVESASAGDEKVSDSKTAEITCPKCESTDIRKNGRRQGKQRYICKDCGREFMEADSDKATDKLKVKASSSVKTSEVKDSSVSATDVSESTSESSKPRSKKKTKAKGFGNPKAQ